MTVILVSIFLIIPLAGIITTHLEKQSKIKNEMIKDQIELEKLKHQNYLIETEKMKLELEKIKIDQPKDEIRF
ncbi:hypothetical protein BABA_22388 [Neobacillus bataviensis LMG 21833]|uniref:Uncharacterized protein n=1 Tax=Neobacillus bataviensis LMG 21833 TaxID=1117379 RepID=K6D9Y0_9BACI|nr:hypothetical protein [Neobacillus bataviensis]EKN64898.1 hypothetical protein BABA_22388 [Neobacillus bataviensis LMG 21833]